MAQFCYEIGHMVLQQVYYSMVLQQVCYNMVLQQGATIWCYNKCVTIWFYNKFTSSQRVLGYCQKTEDKLDMLLVPEIKVDPSF